MPVIQNTTYVNPNVHLCSITVSLAKSVQELIKVCDQQYVQLNQIVTKPWVKTFVTAFNKLYQVEDAAEEKTFAYTR